MKQTHTQPKKLALSSLAAVCIAGSFTIGMYSSDSTTPAMLIEAGSDRLSGDVTLDGTVDAHDAAHIISVHLGYEHADPAAFRNDPDRDGHLTLDDALAVLSQL